MSKLTEIVTLRLTHSQGNGHTTLLKGMQELCKQKKSNFSFEVVVLNSREGDVVRINSEKRDQGFFCFSFAVLPSKVFSYLYNHAMTKRIVQSNQTLCS